MASRGVGLDSAAALFGMFRVNEGGVAYNSLCRSQFGELHENIHSLSIRPIVYLKRNTQISVQDESGVWQISE